MWGLVCTTVVAGSLLVSALMWTLGSYHHSLLQLTRRVEQLEVDNLQLVKHLEDIVTEKVEEAVNQVK